MDFEACRESLSTFLQRCEFGVRVVISHPGSEPCSPAHGLFEACRTKQPSLLLEAQAGGAVYLSDSNDGRGNALGHLAKRLPVKELPEIAKSLGPFPILFLGNCEALCFEELADILIGLRGLHEGGCTARVILCGVRTPEGLERFWKEHRDQWSSPFSSPSNRYWLGGYSQVQIKQRLLSVLSGGSSARIDTLVDMIVSHTSGDRRFVGHLFNTLQDQITSSRPIRPLEVEAWLSGLAAEGELQELVLASVNDLPPRAVAILEATLRGQYICLNVKDLDCEILASRGLLGVPEGSRRPDSTRNWRLASPLLASILRGSWAGRQASSKAFPPEDQLIPVSLPVLPKAQELVTQIENTLRNMMLLTPVSQGEGKLLEQALFKGESLYAKASLMCDQDEDRHTSNLSARPLTSFLETGELATVFENGTFYSDHFADIFPNKSELTNWFKEFNALRNAVAHNKVLSIQALDDLERHLKYLENNMGLATARLLKMDASGEVTVAETKLVQSKNGNSYKVLGQLSAERGLMVDLCGSALDYDGNPFFSKLRRVQLEAGKVQRIEILMETNGTTLQLESGRIEISRAQP